MAPHGREQQKFFLHKNWTKHQYIVEARTSGIWIIVQEDIAWIDVIFEIVDDFSSRKWHGKDMDLDYRQVIEPLAFRPLPSARKKNRVPHR